VPDVRTFVAVDGGMGDNIRPALYDAEYTAVLTEPGDGAQARVAAAWDTLCRTVRADSILLPYVPAGTALHALIERSPLRETIARAGERRAASRGERAGDRGGRGECMAGRGGAGENESGRAILVRPPVPRGCKPVLSL